MNEANKTNEQDLAHNANAVYRFHELSTQSPNCYNLSELCNYLYGHVVPNDTFRVLEAMLITECDAVYVEDDRYVRVDQTEEVIRRYYNRELDVEYYGEKAVNDYIDHVAVRTSSYVVRCSWYVLSPAWQKAYINYGRRRTESVPRKEAKNS